MEVHKLADRWGATGRLHGPYWLWATQGKHPLKTQPEGEVNINFDYQGYLPEAIPIRLAVLDDGAASFLEGFGGGDLVVSSHSYGRAFFFDKVPTPFKRSPEQFELLVREYQQARPIPDAFEWPPPEAPPPTEEEIVEEQRRALERERRILLSDPGMIPVEGSRSVRRRRSR